MPSRQGWPAEVQRLAGAVQVAGSVLRCYLGDLTECQPAALFGDSERCLACVSPSASLPQGQGYRHALRTHLPPCLSGCDWRGGAGYLGEAIPGDETAGVRPGWLDEASMEGVPGDSHPGGWVEPVLQSPLSPSHHPTCPGNGTVPSLFPGEAEVHAGQEACSGSPTSCSDQ